MPPDQEPTTPAIPGFPAPGAGPPGGGPGDSEAVVEFGAPDEPAQEPRARRWDVTGFTRGVAGDRRVVPVAAVLGGVALFASLVSEWQVTSLNVPGLDLDSGGGPQSLRTDVAALGGWGSGYLAGLFLLVAATVLVLFGPPPGRRYARLIGLSGGGVLLALLAALTPTLDDSSRTLTFFQETQVQIETGRGVWCAIAGVVLVVLALALAGRHVAPAPDAAAEGDAEPPQVDEQVWSWRRPEATGQPHEDEPFDLTVTSTTPFTSLGDDRDKPS